ncbi:phosphatidylglycerophosphatase A [bacterium]|nr:phosphatidylglycerophosphatase A [bacterium]
MSKNATQSDILFSASAFLVKGLGTGYSPWMPGTCGSVLGILLAYFISIFGLSIYQQIVLALLLTIISWLLIWYYEKKSHKHDDQQVVIDEIVGMMICLVGVPFSFRTFAAGFLIFRILDIAKPFPVGWIDRKVPGAAGTLFDDVVAGIIGCVFLHWILSMGFL